MLDSGPLFTEAWVDIAFSWWDIPTVKGAPGVKVNNAGNENRDPISNPKRASLHCTYREYSWEMHESEYF